ncbi:hypothetical protein [Pseudoalteromonas rubra]|uniref:hypothetical protein n=1 Tax=Pseudoalteromonas rubra TaxID=43658 RepID=UPI000F7849CB|nr:hypothetical protein [Pseudoalteromonas rubra]
MSVKSNTDGLDKLISNAEELDGSHEVPMDRLLNHEFLSDCSSYSSFEQLIEGGGFKVKSAADFKAIPDEEWDRHISSNTSYDSWDSMLQSALESYTRNLLFKDL